MGRKSSSAARKRLRRRNMRQSRLAQRGALTLEYGILMSGLSLAFLMAVLGAAGSGAASGNLLSVLRQLGGIIF